MESEMTGYLIGAIASVFIHAMLFLLPSTFFPTLLVREIPGSMQVALGAYPDMHSVTTSTGKVDQPKGEEINAEGETNPFVFEDETSGGSNPDRRGDSTLAIPRQEGNPKPPYPEIARRRGYEGQVRLEVEVLSDGTVGWVRVKSSSGYEVLDKSALETVKGWKFIPARFGGVAVKSTVIIPITFKLKE